MDDLTKIEILLGKLESFDGSLVISNNSHVWTVAVTTSNEGGDMTVGAFGTGPDLGEILTDILEELEEY